ncbi:hypothetical protein [Aquidulcibacter sp.]|uniref:hypothetical protein n=1 Tax=Aquidulcibacter sp. TaxID=2052990 RepID=UPI0025BC2304|nr:hypothetical protein [Aquidulcibacter sp.]MCA3694426.1 hypothetical protein [Aquidulcibacter sp.]
MQNSLTLDAQTKIERSTGAPGGTAALVSRRHEVHKFDGFVEAARRWADTMLVLSDQDRAVDGIFKDAGRFVAAMCAVSMREEGVTLVKLKALCARFGLLSAGRARAVLLFLRYLGYVDVWGQKSANGATTYKVNPTFVAAWRLQLEAIFSSLALLDPRVGRLLEEVKDDAIFDTICASQIDELASDVDALNRFPEITQIFVNRAAGSQVLWYLLSFHRDDVFPSPKPVPFNPVILAERFSVSTVHIRRIVNAAINANLLRWVDEGHMVFTPKALANLYDFYGAQMSCLLRTAYHVLDLLD